MIDADHPNSTADPSDGQSPVPARTRRDLRVSCMEIIVCIRITVPYYRVIFLPFRATGGVFELKASSAALFAGSLHWNAGKIRCYLIKGK
jgi:hypothetical protein